MAMKGEGQSRVQDLEKHVKQDGCVHNNINSIQNRVLTQHKVKRAQAHFFMGWSRMILARSTSASFHSELIVLGSGRFTASVTKSERPMAPRT